MATKKIPFDSIYYDPKFNHRGIDEQLVADLCESMCRKLPNGEYTGLLEAIEVTHVIVPGEDGGSESKHKVTDGAHRYLALLRVRDTKEDVFSKIVPNGKIEAKIVEGDLESLKDISVTHNTHRKNLEPWEVYNEIMRRHNQGQDTYEIAGVLRIQQPRVSEFISFQDVLPEIHEKWREGVVAHHDMIQFAALSREDQESAFAAFLSGVEDAGGKKAAARKELKKKVKEKGGKREYANAGKPSRKSMETFAMRAYQGAHTASTAAERHFWNAIAAAFKVVNGQIPFDKLSVDKEYVTKKEVSEAEAALAAEAEKAERKAERAKAAKAKAAKKPKADKKPKAEPKPKADKKPKAEPKPKADKKPKAEKAAKAEKKPAAAKKTKAEPKPKAEAKPKTTAKKAK